MKKSYIAAVRAVVFIAVLGISLALCSQVLKRKSIESSWNYTVKLNGYKNEAKNSFDVLAFGSSHMYCTLNPLCLWKDTGIQSYVLATQQQPLPATYFLIKEALKTQTPKVIIVELAMAVRDPSETDAAVIHDLTDNMPFGLNRLGVVSSLKPVNEWGEYLFPVIKYHDRWKELTTDSFDTSYKEMTDPYHGYVFLRDFKENEVKELDLTNVQPGELNKDNVEALNKMISLTREKGIELLFLLSPYKDASADAALIKAMHVYADENGIDFIDMNTEYLQMGADNLTDYYDGGHFNCYGAEKATSYVGRYITENMDIIPSAAVDSSWQEDYDYYIDALK